MQFEEFEITGAVDGYIKHCIANGTTLMKKVLNRRDILTAVKYTYWKKDFPLNSISDFDSSLIAPNIFGITTNWAVKKIQKFIDSDKSAIAIFQERIVDSSDSYLSDSDMPPYLTSEINYQNGKEVYYFVDQRYCTQAYIEASLSQSGRAGPFSSTALIKLPANIKIEKNIQISEEILDVLSSNVEHLIFGTFDLEGYILCSFVEKL